MAASLLRLEGVLSARLGVAGGGGGDVGGAEVDEGGGTDVGIGGTGCG